MFRSVEGRFVVELEDREAGRSDVLYTGGRSCLLHKYRSSDSRRRCVMLHTSFVLVAAVGRCRSE